MPGSRTGQGPNFLQRRTGKGKSYNSRFKRLKQKTMDGEILKELDSEAFGNDLDNEKTISTTRIAFSEYWSTTSIFKCNSVRT